MKKKQQAEEEVEFDFAPFLKKGRYVHTKEGYIIDRLLFQFFALFFVFSSICAFFMYGGFGMQYAFASCPEEAVGGACDNPLYGECDLPACQKETLFAGESIGEKPPSFFGFYFLQFILFLCVIAVNHLIYNYGEKK